MEVSSTGNDVHISSSSLRRACLSLSSTTALYLFDYLLTLPQEINNIWRCKTTTATVLFLLNRYLFMISRCFRLIQVVSWKGWLGHTADRVRTPNFSFETIPWFNIKMLSQSLPVQCSYWRNIRHSCNISWRSSEICLITTYVIVVSESGILLICIPDPFLW